MASITALPQREREREGAWQQHCQRERERERETEREREGSGGGPCALGGGEDRAQPEPRQGSWGGGGGAQGQEGGPREPFPERERRERERERERERAHRERAEGSYRDRGGALTGQGLLQENIFGELFSGALQENPVIAPGQLHKKCFSSYFGIPFAAEGMSILWRDSETLQRPPEKGQPSRMRPNSRNC